MHIVMQTCGQWGGSSQIITVCSSPRSISEGRNIGMVDNTYFGSSRWSTFTTSILSKPLASCMHVFFVSDCLISEYHKGVWYIYCFVFTNSLQSKSPPNLGEQGSPLLAFQPPPEQPRGIWILHCTSCLPKANQILQAFPEREREIAREPESGWKDLRKRITCSTTLPGV